MRSQDAVARRGREMRSRDAVARCGRKMRSQDAVTRCGCEMHIPNQNRVHKHIRKREVNDILNLYEEINVRTLYGDTENHCKTRVPAHSVIIGGVYKLHKFGT